MCTAILLKNSSATCPLILGFNRDESYDRAFTVPSIKKFKNTITLAPTDLPTGGTWVGANNAGLIVAVLNFLRIKRKGSKSRALLACDLLADCNNVLEAKERLSELDFNHYAPCTWLLADKDNLVIVCFHNTIHSYDLNDGIFILSDRDVFHHEMLHVQWLYKHVNAYYQKKGLNGIIDILSEHDSSVIPALTTCCHAEFSGTTSSQIISINREGQIGSFLFNPTRPCLNNYHDYASLLYKR